MNRMFNKVISLFLVICVTFSLFSCDRKYNEEEVKIAAESLIKRSEIFNEIFWGEGIKYEEDLSTSNGYYSKASDSHLARLGFETIEELKALTKEVYSEEYCKNIFSTVLNAISDGEDVQVLARYYQKYSVNDVSIPEYIMVYTKYTPLFTDEVEYFYDTIEVSRSKKDVVFVTIEVEVKRDKKKQRRTIEIGFIEEKDGWRLHTPTFVSYNEYLDEAEN